MICEQMSNDYESPPPSYDDVFPEVSHIDPKYFDLEEDNRRTYFTRHRRWPEGEGTYRGELDWKGRRSGHGCMVWKDDRVYHGHWFKDRMDGAGKVHWKRTGSYYHGNWKKGKIHGEGRLVYGPCTETPGVVYEGSFR